MNSVSADSGTNIWTQLSSIFRAPITWLVIGYVVLLSPHAYRYLKHHPDERHYTDAGLRMVQNGDYLTPYTPEGNLRLKKPILSYWLVAGSYKLFGVSAFSSRLPFLLVGAGVILLTYLIARYLFGNEFIGLLAAAIVSIQPSLLISSPRSVPDIVLTFCLTLSAYGFVRLLKNPELDWYSLLLAYGGAGLAIEAKGLPALLFVCYAFAVMFLLQFSKVVGNWKHHLTGWAITLTVGLAWYVLMYQLHGEALTRQFFGDQVTDRVNRDYLGVIADFPYVLMIVVMSFVFWWGTLFESLYKNGLKIVRSFDPSVIMFIGWIGIFFCLLAGVDHVNVRYQTPIAPLMAILAAGLISKLELHRQQVWINRLGYVSSTFLVLASIAALGIAFMTGEMVVLATICLAVSGGWVFYFLRSISSLQLPRLTVGAVLTLLAIMPAIYIGAKCLIGLSLEEQLQARIESIRTDDTSIAFFAKPALPSRLRVISSGELDGKWLGSNAGDIAGDQKLDNYDEDIVILSQEKVDELDLSEFEVEKIATNNYANVNSKEVIDSFKKGQLDEYLQERRIYMTFAVRKNSAVSLSQKNSKAEATTKVK